jgi:UDP-glucose 4-epimerase
MRIVITGVAGLLGSRFTQWVLDNIEGAEIWGIDDLSGGFLENIPAKIGNTGLYRLGCESKPNTAWFAEQWAKFAPDYVFHFAAFAAEGLSPFVRKYTVRNTWLATAEVLNCCLNTQPRRLVFTSSMAVYGRQTPPFDEALPRRPIDPYGVGKAACEQDIEIAAEQHGLDYCIIRPHNVYGDRQNIWGDYRNVLGIWMRQHLEGKPLRVYGDGLQSRAFSYIDDCLPCLWRAATEPQASRQIVNLGGTTPTTIRAAAETLAELVGGAEIQYTPPRHEVDQAWSTYQRSMDLLGYRETVSLPEGLARMWQWARAAWDAHPRRRDPQPLAYEVTAGLYPWWQPSASDGQQTHCQYSAHQQHRAQYHQQAPAPATAVS